MLSDKSTYCISFNGKTKQIKNLTNCIQQQTNGLIHKLTINHTIHAEKPTIPHNYNCIHPKKWDNLNTLKLTIRYNQ